jgi:hypothetical protein
VSGVRTHALRWEPELKSGALDRSAITTTPGDENGTAEATF